MKLTMAFEVNGAVVDFEVEGEFYPEDPGFVIETCTPEIEMSQDDEDSFKEELLNAARNLYREEHISAAIREDRWENIYWS